MTGWIVSGCLLVFCTEYLTFGDPDSNESYIGAVLTIGWLG